MLAGLSPAPGAFPGVAGGSPLPPGLEMTAELCSPREELTERSVITRRDKRPCVPVSRLEQRHCHPLHKNNPLPPLEMDPLEKGGRRGRLVVACLIKYWLFLRCRFFCSRKNKGGGKIPKPFADELNVSKHQRVFEGFGGIADFPVLPPCSSWRRKPRLSHAAASKPL